MEAVKEDHVYSSPAYKLRNFFEKSRNRWKTKALGYALGRRMEGAAMLRILADHNVERHVLALVRISSSDHDYAQAATAQLLLALIELESFRGTGRLFIP